MLFIFAQKYDTLSQMEPRDLEPLKALWPHAFFESIGYDPTEAQAPVIEYADQYDPIQGGDQPGRFMAISGGERGGKTITQCQIAAYRMFFKPKGLFWLIGPDYYHTREEFKNLLDIFNSFGLVTACNQPKRGEWDMRLDGGQHIVTRSSKDESGIASEAPDGILMCESGKQTYEAYLKSMGRVSSSMGWLIMSGTIENSSQWYIRHLMKWQGPNSDDAKSFFVPTWTNTHSYPPNTDGADPKGKAFLWVDENLDPVPVLPNGWPEDHGDDDGDDEMHRLVLFNKELKRLRSGKNDQWFFNRYGAKPSVPSGLAIPNFRHTLHVRDLSPAVDGSGKVMPMEIAVDPAGHTYALLILQQVSANRVHILDEIYVHDALGANVISTLQNHPYYMYITGGVIDIAGTHNNADRSQHDLWLRRTGINLRYNYWQEYMPRDSVRNSLAKDSTTGEPKLLFSKMLSQESDTEELAGGILSELVMWKWPKDRGQFSNKAFQPVNKNNDAIKALGYWLLDVFGYEKDEEDNGVWDNNIEVDSRSAFDFYGEEYAPIDYHAGAHWR